MDIERIQERQDSARNALQIALSVENGDAPNVMMILIGLCMDGHFSIVFRILMDTQQTHVIQHGTKPVLQHAPNALATVSTVISVATTAIPV